MLDFRLDVEVVVTDITNRILNGRILDPQYLPLDMLHILFDFDEDNNEMHLNDEFSDVFNKIISENPCKYKKGNLYQPTRIIITVHQGVEKIIREYRPYKGFWKLK